MKELNIENFINSFSEMLIITNEHLVVEYANQRTTDSIGIDKDKVLGKSLHEIINFSTAHLTNLKNLKPEEVLNFEEIIRNPSGYEHRVNIRVKKFITNNRFLLSWILIDYTEETQTRQEMIDFMAQLNQANTKILDYSNNIEIFKTIINKIDQGIIITNPLRNIVFINTSARNLFNLTENIATTDDLLELFSHPGDLPFDNLEASAMFGPIQGEILVFDSINEIEKSCYLSIFRISHIVESEEIFLVWNFVDMGDSLDMKQQFIDFSAELTSVNRELSKKNQEILRLSRKDGLTQIYNREFIIEILENYIKEAATYELPLSIIIFDIDDFKVFNDTHGHIFGDTVIKTVASTAWETLEEKGEIGRYGGEEFLIVLPRLKIQDALIISEKVREKIKHEECVMGVIRATATVTCGLSTYRPGDSVDSLINRADQRLYKGKRTGKNKSVI